MAEPIQGEAGVYVPSEGYLAAAKALCENIMYYLLQMKYKQVLHVQVSY